jgi:ubiquinone/menaquinone biosynthesis C-methylase UbiE
VARISYDEQTAAAYKAVREIPREGLLGWRDAFRRHVRPAPGMTLVDIGAGTGQFAVAFSAWFDLDVIAVEPSASMRQRIPHLPGIDAREGDAGSLPVADDSADAVWISLVLHHIPDLEAAAREIRRVLRPGAPVLIRGGVSGTRHDEIENVRWFPETSRTIDTYPSVDETCAAFATAGFQRETLERVSETRPGSLAEYLDHVDTLRHADTTMRRLAEEEFGRGKERLRRAVESGGADARTNVLDLLVLR